MAAAGAGAVSGGAKAAGYKARSSDAGDPTFGPPTKSDVAAMKRGARASDKAYEQAYEAGADDARKGPGAKDSGGGRSGGVRPSSRATRPRRAPSYRPTNALRGRPVVAGGTPVQEGAGLLLGLVLYALAASYVRYGPAGVRGWLAAKFINKPYGPAAAGTPNAATPHIPTTPAPAAKPSSTTYPQPSGVLV